MKIEINSKSDCPYCKYAKKYLDERGIPYEEFVHDDYDERQKMYASLNLAENQRTVPQIILVENDGTRVRIGGFDELVQSDLADRWAAGNFDADF